MRTVFTIGHSTHSAEHLIDLLMRHRVQVVADVRSTPYSRHAPHFNRETFAHALAERGLGYRFVGDGLGARSPDPRCYLDGRVQYRRLAEQPGFRGALELVAQTAQTDVVALLCSEAEPLACHRSILIARELRALGVPVSHVLADGSVESHEQALGRLLTLLKLQPVGLFQDEASIMNDAYARQEQRIAFSLQNEESAE